MNAFMTILPLIAGVTDCVGGIVLAVGIVVVSSASLSKVARPVSRWRSPEARRADAPGHRP